MNLFWIGLGAFVSIGLALAVCHIRSLHPGVKVWICRLAILKILVSTGFAISVPTAITASTHSSVLNTYLVATWCVGFAIVLWHSLKAYRTSAALLRFAAPTNRVEGIHCREATYLPEPCVVGVLRPVLLLPKGEEVSDSIIHHELAHIRHGDTIFTFLGWVAHGIVWFVPGCGKLVREHSLWQEAWADLTARRNLGLRPGAQARTLLNACDRCRQASAALGYHGDAKMVERRIQAMFIPKYSCLAAVLLLVLVLASSVPVRGVDLPGVRTRIKTYLN